MFHKPVNGSGKLPDNRQFMGSEPDNALRTVIPESKSPVMVKRNIQIVLA
jgi:hypothetical protein